MKSKSEIWTELCNAGLASGEAPTVIHQPTPWYVRAMLGFSGWIGALFLFGFFGLFFSSLLKSKIMSTIAGLGICGAVSYQFRRKAENDFLNQFLFAASLTGQGLVLRAIADGIGSEISTSLIIFVFEAGLLILIPAFLHQVWAATLAIYFLTLTLGQLGISVYCQPLLLAAFAYIWLTEFSSSKYFSIKRALGYGLAFVNLFVLFTSTSKDLLRLLWMHAKSNQFYQLNAFISALLLGAVLVYCAVKLLQRYNLALSTSKISHAILGAAIILGILGINAPGIIVSIVFIVIGFGQSNRALLGLGYLSLTGYLSHYYYSLNWTLLQKSVVLIAIGITLLIIRHAGLVLLSNSEKEKLSHA